MIPRIPNWFLSLDPMFDVILAILGFVVSYYGLRLYRVSSKKSHFNLHLGFMILGAGFLVNGITGIYAILNALEAHGYNVTDLFSGITGLQAILNSSLTPQALLLSRIVNIPNFGYWIYFATSIIAYILFVSMYLQENRKTTLLPVAVMIPFWFDYFATFNVVSILLLSYVVFQTMVNWLDRKNANTLKVAGAFALLLGYHVLLAFSPFSELAYFAAHLSALLSFLLLMVMIRSVSPPMVDTELGLKKLAIAGMKRQR